MKNVIEVSGITKDYGKNRGVFDVSFQVKQGEVLGFLGPNGAGKTTTIRQLMGFIKPDKGEVRIGGMDCFREADRIQERLGYLPGEIAFIDNMTGNQFISFIAEMKGLKDMSRMKELMEFFELDGSGRIRRMSKGTRQKIGIVCAFMQEPETLILDEPTSGLDPLMQNKFIELIRREKERGATVLMSSHLFEEVEHTCDRVAIIREGRIIAVEEMESLKQNRKKIVDILLKNSRDAEKLSGELGGSCSGLKVTAAVSGDMDRFLKLVSRYPVADMSMHSQSLEELFLHYYDRADKGAECESQGGKRA